MLLLDYGRILLRRGWIILLLAALAAGSAYLISTRITPVYRAIQRVLIEPARTDFGLTQSAQQLLNFNSAYLTSSLRAASVIEKLRLDMTPNDLLSRLEVSPDRLSLQITISVDLPDGELANRVAKAFGEELVLYRNQRNQQNRREDQVFAILQDNPTYSLQAPRPTINALAGGLLGVLVGVVIVFLLEYLESSVVRRRSDLERQLELVVLATIPEPKG
jgi:capsular polysaccharide biosynthesis protein